MPTGKVKWYDADRGFGFVSNPGTRRLRGLPGAPGRGDGTRARPAAGVRRRHRPPRPQALRVTVLDDGPRRAQHRYRPDQLHSMVQDTITILENQIQPGLQKGRRPNRGEGHRVAEILRTIARELDS